MNRYVLVSSIIAYLGVLFLIAFWAERNSKSKWVNNPYIYALSLAVYCSAWTYYGSVGVASQSGISFLTIYLGPVIALPLWIVVMRKIISISKQHKISGIADFISLRYGNDRFLGALVTMVCVFAIVPYISLQLKAVSETFEIITQQSHAPNTTILKDTTFYVALFLAVFVVFFGTQATDASKRRKGIMATVALESILKLVFFLFIGIYVTFILFDGTTDLYHKASQLPNFNRITSFGGLEAGLNWGFTIALSFFAIFLLPRQFHVTVVENSREHHLKKAIGFFSLYLLLFNVFVIFIAWGGNLSLSGRVNHDYYTLLLPLANDDVILALLVFLGGFSAVISMVVVSTLALSTMVSNNLIIPYGFLDKFIAGNPEKNTNYIKTIRRIAIVGLIVTAYLFDHYFSYEQSLFSIGLIAFVIIAQLAPAFFIGLYWNRGSSKAAKIGIFIGLAVVAYTLILPHTMRSLKGNTDFIDHGLWGITALQPYQLFGMDNMSPEVHAFFWSLFFNTVCYLSFSLLYKGNYRERNYAEMFVHNTNYASLQEGAFVWKGEAYVSDIRNLLNRFLGKEHTTKALHAFFGKHGISEEEEMADARLINYSEKLLTGSIGGASSKILIASVAKEQPISLIEVLSILEESKKTISTNKALKEKSRELSVVADQLKIANQELRKQDRLKDEFLDTVAHELKTPITSIRAASEVLAEDDHEMPVALRKQFIDNIVCDADRLATLIHNILDLEKLSSGREKLDVKPHVLQNTIAIAVKGIGQIAKKKRIQIIYRSKTSITLCYDEDRMLQVLTNLLSNAIKFVKTGEGIISIDAEEMTSIVKIIVEDNGKGIAEADFDYIFDKFYQSTYQNIKKPKGSGFGLAICKKIIEGHHGKIWADSAYKNGARFIFTIPKNI